MKQFDVPKFYRSPFISTIKKRRKEQDKMKKDFTPTLLDFGPLHIFIARHFGFCYGVENAIDIAFRTIEEHPDKRIFLLSEMIHNPQVNNDLRSCGVQFLQDNSGNQLIPFENLNKDDIVIIPAFGTTIKIEQTLRSLGIQINQFNTTCPFVEKVWNRSDAIGKNDYTVIIHGKPDHEETRATFSHSSASAPSVIIKDMAQAIELAKYINNQKTQEEFEKQFENQFSDGFSIERDLQKIGVVNQTTMLASDTEAISDYLKEIMINKYDLPTENIKLHFADTKDTLCYATNDNQTSVKGMLETKADLSIVVGGYNSSNTSHLVELCEEKIPTYFINSDDKLIDKETIKHYDFHSKNELVKKNYLPEKEIVSILLTSGASCPDAIVEGVIKKLAGFYPSSKLFQDIIREFQ